MNYRLIASGLYTLGSELCARCFEYLDEQTVDRILRELALHSYRSISERIEIIAGLDESGRPLPPDLKVAGADEQWRAMVGSVFAAAHTNPERLTSRFLREDFRPAPSGRLDHLSIARLIEYDNAIEQFAQGESARSPQVRAREWFGFLAASTDLARLKKLASLEGHALEFIFRATGAAYSDELVIRDTVLEQELGLPDYPATPPPWALELAEQAGVSLQEPGTLRFTTTP